MTLMKRLAGLILGAATAALLASASPAMASIPPDPGEGNCVSLNTSYYGVVLGKTTTDGYEYDQIGADECMTRSGGSVHISYRWGVAGDLRTGAFHFQLVDCTAKKIVEDVQLTYSTPTKTKSVSGTKTFALSASHTYEPRAYANAGNLDRVRPAPDSGYVGYFDAGHGFFGLGNCA